jgi:hypothetical protein
MASSKAPAPARAAAIKPNPVVETPVNGRVAWVAWAAAGAVTTIPATSAATVVLVVSATVLVVTCSVVVVITG